MSRVVLPEGHVRNGASPPPRRKVRVTRARQGPALPLPPSDGACCGDAETLQAGTPIQPQLTPLPKGGPLLPNQILRGSSVGPSQVQTNPLGAPRRSAGRGLAVPTAPSSRGNVPHSPRASQAAQSVHLLEPVLSWSCFSLTSLGEGLVELGGLFIEGALPSRPSGYSRTRCI